jgi:hypothetical protein
VTEAELPPATARLPAHVVFRELPFCGVLFDSKRARVYRLTQRQAALLRQALSRADEPSLATTAGPPASARDPSEAAGRLLDELGALGLVQTGDEEGSGDAG